MEVAGGRIKMNEKRACENLLVPYLIFELTRDATDHKSRRVQQYFLALLNKVVEDKEKIEKILRRLDKARYDIFSFLSNDGIISGHKVVICCFHLTQTIFNNHCTEKNLRIFNRINFMIDFVLTHEFEERYKRLDSDEDFEKLEKSARKQAAKIYESFFKKI